MVSWRRFYEDQQQLAEAVAARFKAHKHHVLATLRSDGAPRVSGIEVTFFGGELLIGSMPGARKAQDLRREPRFALHSNPAHHSMTDGDAKVSGSARELDDAERRRIQSRFPDDPADADVFVLDVDEVVLTSIAGDRLCIDIWRIGRGVERFVR